MTVIFHPRIRTDLRGILEYYDERSDIAGDRFFAEFEAKVARIKDSRDDSAPESEYLDVALHCEALTIGTIVYGGCYRAKPVEEDGYFAYIHLNPTKPIDVGDVGISKYLA